MKATDKDKKGTRSSRSKRSKAKVSRSEGVKAEAKAKALAAVDALLKQPAGVRAGKGMKDASPRTAEPGRSGATVAGAPRPAPSPIPRVASPLAPPTPAAQAAANLPESRFERSIARAQKGDPGPIRLADLILDARMTASAHESGRVKLYRKILTDNPAAQPGRPLVNIVGHGDGDLKFQLLSLHELVLAAMAEGRDVLQVLLVRLTAAEADDLLAQPEVAAPAASPSALEIAQMQGFLEIPIKDINRSENLRQEVATGSAEFRNLVASVRTIGLQNPPVVEVRPASGEGQAPAFICISGHRRLLALEALGQERVTCALKTFRSDRHRALAGLAENINREDLHFLDKADGYGLLAQQGMTAHEIAALLDADSRTVGKYLRAASWDVSVKRRIRALGARATTRFLLNMLAAGERTTPELLAIIERFVSASEPAGKPSKGVALRQKLDEFYTLSGVAPDQRLLVEKALRFLGYLR